VFWRWSTTVPGKRGELEPERIRRSPFVRFESVELGFQIKAILRVASFSLSSGVKLSGLVGRPMAITQVCPGPHYSSTYF
jgi:hypothetical protein